MHPTPRGGPVCFERYARAPASASGSDISRGVTRPGASWRLLERNLGRSGVAELREVITDAWVLNPPKRLAASFLAGEDEERPLARMPCHG